MDISSRAPGMTRRQVDHRLERDVWRSVPSGFVGRMVTVDAPGILRVGGIAHVAPDRWSFVDALATMPWDDARNLYAYLVTHARLGPEHLREHLAAHPHRRGNGQL